MSEETARPKVVNLGQHKVTEERGGELLNTVSKIAVEHTQKLAGSLFENVDDALFDLAEKAESNAVQTRYFDGMREVRRKRQLIERLYVDNVRQLFKQFANGKLLPPMGVGGSGNEGNRDNELSLVDEAELEESLAVTSMISKAENRYARLLYSVNQRLSVISGGSKVIDGNNPLGPACQCDCFRRAMQELDVDVNVKLIIYKLFERYILTGLESLYDAVNNALIRAGVLPQLRHRVGRGQKGAAHGAASTSQATPAGIGPDDRADEYGDYPYSEEEAAVREQLYATINDLLAQRRHSAPAYSQASRAASGPPLSVRELISALALLQQQAPPVPEKLPTLDDEDNGVSLAELKEMLHKQISKVSSNTKARVSEADADTIDLVGMLFEYILEDRNLPAQMQAMLGRLQIPYLKAAILDQRLFAKHTHPARRLLDHLAEAAKGWSKESDHDLRLFNEIKSIVETLLHDFDDDTTLFDHLLERFKTFVTTNEMRADRVEKRTADATRGKEKLLSARRTAAREVLSRTQDAQIPDLIRNILTRPWANYLVLTLLREGENSSEWRAAVHFIDDLIASARPPATDDDRRRIRESLPSIEKNLRNGLATVAFSDSDVRRLMRALGRFYHGQLGENPAEALAAQAEEPAGEPVIPASVEAIVMPEEPPEPVAPIVEADTPALAEAKALKVGNWVEFVAENGQRDRAKLSWISPISGKYLFVNRRGLKVCDMSLQALAASIVDGSTVILEEVPLFDRALDAIVERLKQSQSASGKLASAGTTPPLTPLASSDDTASAMPSSSPNPAGDSGSPPGKQPTT